MIWPGSRPACSHATRREAYALFDGLFYQALVRHLAGDPEAAADLERSVPRVLDLLTG